MSYKRKKKRNCLVTILQKSCLTGQVVWIYQGPSKRAAKVAYQRACQREIERVRRWRDTLQQRKSNIMRMLNELMAGIPVTSELNDRQKDAVRQLQSISNEDNGNFDFYEHIKEEQRRKEAEKVLYRNRKNGSYDK